MIKFVNPFETSIVNNIKNISPKYICIDCIYNKTSLWDEDLGCSLNERLNGDLVTHCGSFTNNHSQKLSYFLKKLFK